MAQDAVTGPQDEPRFSELGAPEIGTDDTIVAAYAALVGNRKRGTSAARVALTGKKLWEGLAYFETDTGQAWVYAGSTWVRGTEPAVTSPGLNWNVSYGNGPDMFLQKKNGFVECDLHVARTGALVDGLAPGVFPVGFRPKRQLGGTGLALSGGGAGPAGFTIATNGTLTLYGTFGANTQFKAMLRFEHS